MVKQKFCTSSWLITEILRKVSGLCWEVSCELYVGVQRHGEILKFRVDKMDEDGRGVLLLHYTFRKKGKTRQYKNWKEDFKASNGI